MKTGRLFLLALLSFWPLQAETLIEGVVSLPDARGRAASAARYQLKSGAVATPEPPMAVVYLEGSFPEAKTKPSADAKVEQKGFQFSPALLPVQKGASVEFPNLDEDYHHVFSYSRAKAFDLGRFRKDEKQPVVQFEKEGTVKVGCEIHDHMRAIILVLDSPYFVKTDADGKYRLSIPESLSGKYTLKAWISDRDVRETPVELKNGQTVKIDFPSK